MPIPVPALDVKSSNLEELRPMFFSGIRIRRIRYKGQNTTYRQPEAGVSIVASAACCHHCSVTWVWTKDVCGKVCWVCGDDRVLPEPPQGECYDHP